MSSGFLYCQLLHVYNAKTALTLSSRKFQNVQFIFSLLSFNVFPFREQNIVNTVGEEIKRLLEIFKIRNPMFNGKYSVCGHSLGRKWHSLNFPFFVDSFDLITGKGINVLLFWSIDTVEHLDLMLNGKFWNPLADRMGHFRAAQSFCFKARSSAKLLLWKCLFIVMRTNLIFTRKVLDLTSFWKWEFCKLGNDLMCWKMASNSPFSSSLWSLN